MVFHIQNVPIGPEYQPFIIAEMSGNHNQSKDRALEIVEAAAYAGAHAIKLQTYTADTMTLDVENDYFKINDPDSLWADRYLYDLYEDAHTPWSWHEDIFKKATECGIICFSSPFDETAVDFLESLNAPAYKIASFEITHLPLIQKVAQTGKPMIISTGMANANEIQQAVKCARENGCKDIILLKCTSSYPATPESSNILTIPDMHQKTGCLIGLSDHTLGIGTAIASVAHGACVIEKHVTLSRKEGGVDSAFSLEPKELETLVIETKTAWASLGAITYEVTESEKNSLKFRRSIFYRKDLSAGHIITENDIKIIRPGDGLSPHSYSDLIGKKLVRNVEKGTPTKWTDY